MMKVTEMDEKLLMSRKRRVCSMALQKGRNFFFERESFLNLEIWIQINFPPPGKVNLGAFESEN